MKTRDDRTAFALSCRLNLPALLRWLLMVSVLAGPGYAYAALDFETARYGCITTNGQSSVILNLPPSVSFSPDSVPGNGTVIYKSKQYEIQYKCKATLSNKMQLVRLSDANPLGQVLNDTGLKMTLKVSNTDGLNTSYDPLPPAGDQKAVSWDYTGTMNGTLTIQLILTVEDRTKIRASFAAAPSLSGFKLIGGLGYITSPSISINTTPVRIQYVPKCFVKTSVDPVVDFGSVISSDVNNNFSLSHTFDVKASVSESGCDTGNLKKKYKLVNAEGVSLGEFSSYLPLKVTFSVTSGGVQSGNAIILHNADGQENGLQLKISDNNGPVTLGADVLPDASPGNKLGVFQDGTFDVTKTYMATLSSTGQAVKTGKYRTQVTVKVDYY